MAKINMKSFKYGDADYLYEGGFGNYQTPNFNISLGNEITH